MADKGKIYITISDRRIGENGQIEGDNTQENDAENNKNVLGEFVKHKFFNLIQSQAKQIAMYSVNNIGNFTGDYQIQREVNVAVKLLNMGVSLGTSFASGLSVGGPVGGVVAVAVSMVAMGTSIALEEVSGKITNRNQNYHIEQLREISGLNALTNGSR